MVPRNNSRGKKRQSGAQPQKPLLQYLVLFSALVLLLYRCIGFMLGPTTTVVVCQVPRRI